MLEIKTTKEYSIKSKSNTRLISIIPNYRYGYLNEVIIDDKEPSKDDFGWETKRRITLSVAESLDLYAALKEIHGE